MADCAVRREVSSRSPPPLLSARALCDGNGSRDTMMLLLLLLLCEGNYKEPGWADGASPEAELGGVADPNWLKR